MKRTAALFISLLALMALGKTATAKSIGEKEAGKMVQNITWLGHDMFKITGEKTIYTDPFEVKTSDTADIILVTHGHRDHCSPDDIKKLRGPNTIVVATEDCAEKIGGNVHTMKPGDKWSTGGIDIEAVAAYNTNKKFHPKANQWVGYIFTVQGQRIYLAGDTDRIPEMKDFNCDVALLPVSGTYVMTADEAVEAARDINPSLAVPMHFGSIVGTKDDALKFKKELEGKIEVIILPDAR